MLAQKQLLQSHYYNPETGLFYKRMTAGQLKEVGSNCNGYLLCTINYRHYLVHRLAWLYTTGEWPEEDIDHRDDDKANNKWSNLRLATKSGNQENQKHAQASNLSTGLLGASSKGSRFQAQITVKGKRLHLGTFDTAEDAHQTYIEAKRKLHLFNTL